MTGTDAAIDQLESLVVVPTTGRPVERLSVRDRATRVVASMSGDRADAAAAANGDVQAFERLYRAHMPRIHSLVRRMTGGVDTDDLTQDVFVRTWSKLSSFRGDSTFGTWIYRLAVNVVVERFRTAAAKRHWHQEVDAPDREFVVPADRPETRLDLDAAVMRLPPGAREVFVLHDVEGHKHAEIADLLEISIGTSKAQLHRARMMLRRHLR